MNDTSTTIEGVHRFTPAPIRDERGFFSRTFDVEWCREAGVETEFVQHNQSRSAQGVLRGLHVRAGASEAKLVRCAHGSIVDFVVDVRPWSPTYRRVERFELNDETMVHLYLPPFVAHGFQVLSPHADVCYLHSRPYEAGADLAIAWNDPTLDIPWPITPPLLSERDRSAPLLSSIDLDAAFRRG
jgi:dTDP-4-dehydrorhamnose 3,5-epimerase